MMVIHTHKKTKQKQNTHQIVIKYLKSKPSVDINTELSEIDGSVSLTCDRLYDGYNTST